MNIKDKLMGMLKETDVVDLMPITIYKDGNIYRLTCDGDPSYVAEFDNARDAVNEAFYQSNVYSLIEYLIKNYDKKTDMVNECIWLMRSEKINNFGISLGSDDINSNIYTIPDVTDTAYDIIQQKDILDDVIGTQEAGELWGLSADRIKALCADGTIRAKKIGNTWVIDRNQPNPRA